MFLLLTQFMISPQLLTLNKYNYILTYNLYKEVLKAFKTSLYVLKS